MEQEAKKRKTPQKMAEKSFTGFLFFLKIELFGFLFNSIFFDFAV